MDSKTDGDYARMWDALASNAKETLTCLCRHGPTWDGDLPSKVGRDALIENKMAAKIVMGDQWRQVLRRDKNILTPVHPEMEFGFQAATYLGAWVYRCGVIMRRKDVIRKLVGNENVR